MTKKVLYSVDKRPTKEAAGVTSVKQTITTKEGVLESNSTIGEIRRERNSANYPAFMANQDGTFTQLPGEFSSRSQAGHAIQRAWNDANKPAEVAEAPAEVAEASAEDLGGEAA